MTTESSRVSAPDVGVRAGALPCCVPVGEVIMRSGCQAQALDDRPSRMGRQLRPPYQVCFPAG